MTAEFEPHACSDCEVCGCECPEACAWPCPCYEAEALTQGAFQRIPRGRQHAEQETTK